MYTNSSIAIQENKDKLHTFTYIVERKEDKRKGLCTCGRVRMYVHIHAHARSYMCIRVYVDVRVCV